LFASAFVKKLQVSVLPISEIRVHEGTVPSLLAEILADMKSTGCQRDPILVDRQTRLALDGMHRLKSLKRLGAKFAVCAEYDYLNRSVKLGRWLRTIVSPNTTLIDAILSRFSMNPCTSARFAMRRVDDNRKGLALLFANGGYYGGGDLPLFQLFSKLGQIDRICEKKKFETRFVPESDEHDLRSSKSQITVYPPRLLKTEVIEFAMQGRLLPYKTTRHIVPVRLVGIDFPIRSLRTESLEDCNELLEEVVKFSKVILKRRNIWYEGRRYSERLAIFSKTRGLRHC
jgi:hypothetical protein